ncbi:MAG: FAD-dependent oxidoreductase [Syntrophales bacterium]
MADDLNDTIIIGGGPAAAGAAVYAARKKMKTMLICEEFSGQSSVSVNIENWIGEVSISGMALSEKLEKHIRAQKDIRIKTPEKVTAVAEKADHTFEVSTDKGGLYQSKTLIIASGGKRKRLEVPGETRLEGNGVAYCSTCDAPFYQDQDVAVVGGGNSALETVIDLISYARKIYLLIRRDRLKADPVLHEKTQESAKVQIIPHVEVLEILGEEKVTGLRYADKKDGGEKRLAVSGVFIAIGTTPNSDFIRHLVDTNQFGEILLDHRTAATSKRGIFAAGDVTNDPFKQNNISIGDGVRAALSAYNHILDIQKYSPCAEP